MVSSIFQEVAVATAHMASKYDSHSEPSLSAKVHRIQSGDSLDSICERTKISRYFLEAIEDRAYHRLPGGVFDINYIRQYSESVGCNAETLLADYQSVSKHVDAGAGASPVRVLSWRWIRSLVVPFCP